jgi:V/A-type H+-transporting ATPase subunit F
MRIMKWFLISDDLETQIGFSLAGIRGVTVHTKQEACEAIDAVLKNRNIGLLFFTENISKLCDEKVAEIEFACKQLLILSIPNKDKIGNMPKIINDFIFELTGIKFENFDKRE